MEALDLIRYEHQQILRVLERLLERCQAVRRGERVPPLYFVRAADFLLTWIELSHHAKEILLFREMKGRGLVSQKGMLAQLAAEHATGRELARSLREHAGRFEADGTDVEGLVGAAEDYVRLHLAHSDVEDRELLPLARRLVGTEALERLRTQFARLEARYGPVADAAAGVELAALDRGPRWPGGGK